MSDDRSRRAPGRRVASRSARSRATSRSLALPATLALPVLAALVVLATQLAGPAEPATTPPRQVALDRATVACPTVGGTVAAGQVAAGRSASASSLPRREPVRDLQRPDRWRTARVGGEAVVLDQTGRGSGAVGFASGAAPRSQGAGLVVGSCPEAGNGGWILGAGSGGRHQTRLVLTNLADTPAVVDVRLWGPSGRVDAVNATGVVVEPRDVRTIALADLAAGEPRLSAQVVRRRGALSVQAVDGSTGAQAGTEVVRSTLSPRRDQVVGPVPAGRTGRTLTIVNPTDSVARVEIDALGKDGRFTPRGLEDVRVRPNRMLDVDLPTTVGSDAVALRVRSSTDVAASVRTAPGGADFATSSASTPLRGPAVVPIGLDVRRVPTLVLANTGDRGARATVTAYDVAMKRLGSTSVRVPVGSTVDARIRRELPVDRAAYLVVRTTGDLVGSAVYADGDRVAVLGLRPAPVTAAGPRVRPAG